MAAAFAPAQTSTYLFSMGRYDTAPAPWTSWNQSNGAWNFPGLNASITLHDVETAGNPIVATIAQHEGNIVSFKGGQATTSTFFGHAIPSTATASTFSLNGGDTGSFTLRLSGFAPFSCHVFQALMSGTSPTPTTWTLTGAPGSSFTNTADGFDASPSIRTTGSGTIDVRFDFQPSSGASAVEAIAFQSAPNVTWGPVTPITANSDIVNPCGVITALNWGNATSNVDVNVNGQTVTFVPATLPGLNGAATNDAFFDPSGTSVQPDFETVLDSFVFQQGPSDGTAVGTWTFSGLDSDTTYDLQVFAADDRGQTWNTELDINGVKTTIYASPASNTFATARIALGSGETSITITLRAIDIGPGGDSFGLGNVTVNAALLSVPADCPPIADAGADFAVNEGQTFVMLDGSASIDPDSDPLTYAWTQIGGTTVTLSNTAAREPTFTAPVVAIGGETLTFELTVTANGKSDTDTVDVTVVNVNHAPVADAGSDQSIAEGSLVTLDGTDSFDVDNDPLTYAWQQTTGPAVTLSDASAASPAFTAPLVATNTTATLVFSLTVDDGFVADAPAPGYALTDVTDTVTITVTNVNNAPIAAAGSDQTVDENTAVTLDGSGSSDPDSDPLTFAWTQVGGPIVTLAGAGTATPSFTAPFVNPGGSDLTFKLTVNDGAGGLNDDTVVVHVLNRNDPPLVSAARPTIAVLWPPNHKLVSIGVLGVSDPDNNATITINKVMQDEPTNGTGDGDTPIDAFIQSNGTVLLRAERSGNGNGRVYHIHFTASDSEGSASGVITVSVAKKKKTAPVDGGELHDSTQ